MEELQELLQQALELAQKGLWQECMQICQRILQDYPHNLTGLYYCALSMFRQRMYDSALDLFVQCYNHTSSSDTMKEEVLNQILTAYYEPNINVFRANYEQNVACLSDYEHNYLGAFPGYDDLPYVSIPRDNRDFYILDKRAGQIITDRVTLLSTDECETDASIDSVVLSINVFDVMALQTIEAKTTNPTWENGHKRPFYVLWEDAVLRQVFLQLQDYRPLVEKNRVVFFAGCGDDFASFLKDPQSYLPEKVVVDHISYPAEVAERISAIIAERQRDYEQNIAYVRQMADRYDLDYYREIITGDVSKLRILFITTRFSWVVRFATRDFMAACQDQGMTCDILIDKSDIQSVRHEARIDKIAQYKPNIIFIINYFKADSVFADIPENILFVTWMQDPGEQIYSLEHAQRFACRDFALALPEWRKIMVATGFEPSRISVQAVPIDENVFYPRSLSESEQAFYGADIALPANYILPGDGLAMLDRKIFSDLSPGLGNQHRESFLACMLNAYDAFCHQAEAGVLFTNSEQCAEIIQEACTMGGLSMEKDFSAMFAKEFFMHICYIIHRKTTLKWITDAGLKINLWGRGWDKDIIFKKLNKGIIEHGQDLAKMFSATKIILANCSHCTGHARFFEALACGALPMVRYIPREYDMADVRDEFRENEHFVFYYDRRDLIDKLEYYLAHEDERQRIVNNGRRRVLETMTYGKAVDNLLALIRRNLTT